MANRYTDRIVDVLDHYPEYLSDSVLEYQAIAKAENPEFNLFIRRLGKTIENILPTTSDEDGIKRYEDWLDILSNPNLSIEERRFNVLARLNETLPYTEIRLQKMLAAICGWGHFTYERKGAFVHVVIDETCYGAVFSVMDLLERVLPLNLYYRVSYGMTRQTEVNTGAFLYYGQEITLNPYEEHEFETETQTVYASAHLSMEINKWQ